MVTGMSSPCLFFRPRDLASYFLPYSAENAEWEGGRMCSWQPAKVNIMITALRKTEWGHQNTAHLRQQRASPATTKSAVESQHLFQLLMLFVLLLLSILICFPVYFSYVYFWSSGMHPSAIAQILIRKILTPWISNCCTCLECILNRLNGKAVHWTILYILMSRPKEINNAWYDVTNMPPSQDTVQLCHYSNHSAMKNYKK